jgi:hypothetical protein
MSNDKKSKKEKPKVVHGASYANRGGAVAANLLAPAPKAPLAPQKKKK